MDNGYEDFRRVCKVSFMPLSDQNLWHSSKDKKKGKAEYVWIDDSKIIRSKTLMISGCLDEISELPLEEHSSKFTLRPIAIFDDISENERDVLVLCEMDDVHPARLHHTENKRKAYRKIMLSDHVVKADLRFEIEQEFVFRQCIEMKNFSMGKARKVTEAFCKACFNALIPIYSVTYKTSHNECWSYKIGPCTGSQAGDMLWISRYIIKRISEEFDLTVTFEPLNSIASGDNLAEEFRPSTKYRFSSEDMRDIEKTNAVLHVEAAHNKLIRHSEHHHVDHYSSIEEFYGQGCQHSMCLVRIPHSVEKSSEKSEYVEDGRPTGFSDPYDVISYIVKTCFL